MQHHLIYHQRASALRTTTLLQFTYRYVFTLALSTRTEVFVIYLLIYFFVIWFVEVLLLIGLSVLPCVRLGVRVRVTVKR